MKTSVHRYRKVTAELDDTEQIEYYSGPVTTVVATGLTVILSEDSGHRGDVIEVKVTGYRKQAPEYKRKVREYWISLRYPPEAIWALVLNLRQIL